MTILAAVALVLVGVAIGAAALLGWFLWRYFTAGQKGPGG